MLFVAVEAVVAFVHLGLAVDQGIGLNLLDFFIVARNRVCGEL
jgi:hypothetical protein